MSLLLLVFSLSAWAQADWNVPVSGQYRVFPNVPQHAGQSYNSPSIAIKPKYKKNNFFFETFYRWDEQDQNRTHGDIRELSFTQALGDGQLTYGISKVFWGVTETQHLVDVINQTDFVESGDSTEKLGQPMLRWIRPTDHGKWDLFLLFGFRERTFPGVAGRLRGPYILNTEFTERVRKSEVDIAARWSHQFDRFDLGVSGFFGSAREPALRINNILSPSYTIATYDEIAQLGVDAQYTLEKIIWKLEAVYRDGKGSPEITQNFVQNPNDFFAYTAGGEYSLGTFKGTELGVLFEYSYDSRQPRINNNIANPAITPVYAIFQNDYFVGLRWILNDAYESNFFLGTALDNDTRAATVSLRYSRRIQENLSLNFRSVTLTNVPDPNNDPYAAVQNDSFYEINLTQYFLF